MLMYIGCFVFIDRRRKLKEIFVFYETKKKLGDIWKF